MKEPVAVVGMVLGYASALCYLWYVPSHPIVSTGMVKVANVIWWW
jgi:hypothetical protein